MINKLFRNIGGDLAISEAEINFEKYFFVTSFDNCGSDGIAISDGSKVIDHLMSELFIRSRDNPLNPSCITEESLQFESINMNNGQIKSLGRFSN